MLRREPLLLPTPVRVNVSNSPLTPGYIPVSLLGVDNGAPCATVLSVAGLTAFLHPFHWWVSSLLPVSLLDKNSRSLFLVPLLAIP